MSNRGFSPSGNLNSNLNNFISCCSGMRNDNHLEQYYKGVIKENLHEFYKSSNFEVLEPHLITHDLLTEDESTKLVGMESRLIGKTNKGQYFYSTVLPSKGKFAYCTFVTCLCEALQKNPHPGHSDLFGLLTKDQPISLQTTQPPANNSDNDVLGLSISSVNSSESSQPLDTVQQSSASAQQPLASAQKPPPSDRQRDQMVARGQPIQEQRQLHAPPIPPPTALVPPMQRMSLEEHESDTDSEIDTT